MLDNKTFQSQFATAIVSGISEPLYIMKGTGACYLSIRATARLIDKHPEYVSRYVKSVVPSVTNVGTLEAEVLTGAGLRSVTLLPENVILGVIAKYKPELLLAFAQLGLRSWLYEQAGYTKSETPTKDINDNISQLLQLRTLSKNYHTAFQLCCTLHGFPANKVHDELTRLVNGNTAEDNRAIPELIGDGFDDENVGINHVCDKRFHFVIAMSKKYFANSHHKTDWKNELVRAYHKAVKDWNNLNG